MCTLHSRIIELCKERGISGSRMCLDLGMSKSTLSDLKSGRKKSFTAGTAQKIASYLGVSVAYLLGEEENEGKKEKPTAQGDGLSKEMLELIDELKGLHKDEILMLLQVARSIRKRDR